MERRRSYTTLTDVARLLPENVYEVARPFRVQSGITLPWFGAPGGGIQYKTYRPIQWYLDEGYLMEAGSR